MKMWPDADAREAFVREIDTNFSLIAPAGVGKTHSIVQRILEIARRDSENSLPKLVVVTYTRRAANEMRDRVHLELLALGAAPYVFAAMDRAFFGTIHAFCTKLLQSYGIYIGLPTVFEPVPNAVRLWETFLFSPEGEMAVEVGVNVLGAAARHLRMQEFLNTPPADEIVLETPIFSPPTPDFSELLSEDRVFEARADSRDNVREGQRLAALWLERFHSDTPFLPLPSYSKGGKKFLVTWEDTFAPLQKWVQTQVKCAHRAIALKYRQWRLEQGSLFYSDQIAFAAQLLKHPKAGVILRRQNLSVILDEAQDTDPLQFEVLFEISNGRISMVGDPQQSIYGDRADLRVYQQFQKRLCGAPKSRELRYGLTFRCRSSILDFVNHVGPELLSGKDGQVEFIPLQSACEGDAGQVLRLPIGFDRSGKVDPSQAKISVANAVAAWLYQTGLKNLRARDWSEVAILCPRKRWLETLAISLRQRGFSVQMQSDRSILGDSPVYAWWTSLFWVLTHPTDSFEIAGLLREMFAVRDSDLASLCNGDSSRLHAEISAPLPVLQLLGKLSETVKTVPLRSAVDFVLRETYLLERLLSLPGEDPTALRTRHAELLTQASAAEACGLTLKEFALELRDNFECASESPQVHPGAVQLITCQKAKGLEWDAVVVPYFYRRISFRRSESDVDPVIRMQEMQRLLYVTLTRARNTLVLVDDSAYFSSKEKSKSFSFVQILGEEGLQSLSVLPQKATVGDCQSVSFTEQEQCPTSPCSWIEAARQLALRFPRKITPHNLATGGSLPKNTAALLETSNLDYGIWWHESAQILPLQEPHWMLHLEKILQKCPDVERGRYDWQLFSRSALAKRLVSNDYLLFREMPFFFLEEDTAMEGIMDLAALHRIENNWLLLDWKTDRGITISSLLERYRAQLEAYARCLYILTGKEVEAGLYGVSLGEWIPLERRKF